MTTTDAVKVPQPRPAGPKVKALEQTVLASPAKLVRVIGTSNLATLSGVQTVDSVALKLGDVVLLTGQTTTHQNRLWTVMQGTWIAPLIADHPEKLPAGTKVTAQEGTSNAGKTFRLTTTGTIVLGTTALSWTQDGGSSGSGDVVGPSSATDGSLARFDGTTGKLLKDGVAPDASTLEISGSTLRQKDAGTTNAKLANMATKTYKGRTSGTTGVPEDVSAANLATDLASQTAFSGTYVPLAPTATTFTGDHTAALTDIGKVIEITNGDLTIPTNATVAFPVGQTLEVLDCGATSAVNVVNAPGVQVQSRGGKFTSAGQYASFVLRQRSTDVWHVAGDLVAFAPDTLSGLVFWFKGGSTYWQDSGRTTPAVADGDPVAAWDDSSVGANHATTATAGYRPTLKTGANGINGVSVLRWDGTDDNLVSAASASTKPFTLFAVCKPTSFAAGRAIVGAPSVGGMSTVITTGGKQEALKSGTAVIGDSTTALTAAAACIIELTYSSSGGFAFYKAGVADGSGTGNQTFTSMSTVLGKDPGGGGSTFLGDIAEIIKYDAVLTANQLQAVENYLGNKYGIAVS